jgi:hypothetical protein
VPRFVERELRGFLRCGILAHGFVRVHCDGCGLDRVVAFSCKGRGFCPSCGGRRMADTAAHLVDRVLPEVPVRQWVLSLPFALRYRLAYDAALSTAVLGVFVHTVGASLRRRARKKWGVTRGRCGAVTFVQRFGDALNLNVHFHSLLLDGVYAPGPDGALCFRPLPPPQDAEVARVVSQVARRIARLLERRGLGPEADPLEADPLAEEQPLLAQLYGASVAGRIATGRRAGQRVLRVGDCIDPEVLPAFDGERCASASGVSLHANVAVPTRDRRRLERLCRYVARPPVATERLSRLEDPVPPQAPLARRHDPRRLRAAGARREARGPGAAAALPPRAIPRHPGTVRERAGPHRAGLGHGSRARSNAATPSCRCIACQAAERESKSQARAGPDPRS